MNAYAKARHYINTEKGAEQLKQAARDAVEATDGHPFGGLEFNVNYYPRLNLFSGDVNVSSQGGEEYKTLATVAWFSSNDDVDEYLDLFYESEMTDDVKAYIIKLAKDEALKNEETPEAIAEMDDWWISLNYIDFDLDTDLPIEMQKSLYEAKYKKGEGAKVRELVLKQKVELCIIDVMLVIAYHENDKDCEDYEDEDEECAGK